MAISFTHSRGSDATIVVPAIGLDLLVRLAPSATEGAFTVIETINAPGFGRPRHRHREAEVFRVLEGQYLFEVDGNCFVAETGDVVSVPGGAAHAFVNLSPGPARQLVIITPGLDAAAFFTGLAAVMGSGMPEAAALALFGDKWGIDFLGSPLRTSDVDWLHLS